LKIHYKNGGLVTKTNPTIVKIKEINNLKEAFYCLVIKMEYRIVQIGLKLKINNTNEVARSLIDSTK
jgi:hypothetical protein